jgi:hypothetical protein
VCLPLLTCVLSVVCLPLPTCVLSVLTSLHVCEKGSLLRCAFLSISLPDPLLILQPEVATVLPGQEEVTLSCMTTDSARLSVRWTAGNSEQVLSTDTSYRVSLPSESTSYRCSVIDNATNTTLTSDSVSLRNVQGMCA